MKSFIEGHYGDKLGKYTLVVKTIAYEEMDASVDATAIYTFPLHKRLRVFDKPNCSKQIIPFCYSTEGFSDNAVFSLAIEHKTIIYINKDV